MNDTTDYVDKARADAAGTAANFINEIAEQLLESGEASTDLFNDYPGGDEWHHECHVDQCFDLSTAAEVLDQLGDHEETDTGLWEGMKPREAIGAQAAYTYGNAVYHYWRKLIREINGDPIIQDALQDNNDGDPDARGEVIKGLALNLIREWE